ncbi:vacuolar sorting protein 9 (VPS9) domain containing protein [Aureococcus anophagefferens]|nr:vacuolar sorting protein 9 (VPS9) domain containing protein [Aureococcus anophagefferens]
MADSPLDETAFAALVRDATDEDLPALACARGADDAWRVARSGLLLTSYTDDGGARKWAYRYAALRVGDGSALACAAGEPERFWRAVDEGDAAAWRAALNGAQTPAAAGAAVHGGPLLCWRVGDADASWRERYCELRRAARRASELPPRPARRSWRDHEVHALGDLAAVHLRRRDDLETPGFELADGGGRLCCAPPDDSAPAARGSRSSRALRVRSGGADDALPPTLKIDGDADGDDDGSDDEGGRLLEAPVVVVARLGDAVAASRVARSAADRRLAAVKETMDGALRCLAGAEPAPPAPSDSDSDDDPASHASFHRFARPAARAAEARTGAGWYALLADEDAAAAGEEEVEGGSAFVDGATDDASGLRRGNVAALVEARVAVSRRAPAAFLGAARRAKDRPPRDDAPSPAATVELLKRLFVVVAWVQGLVSAVDRLLRWDAVCKSNLQLDFNVRRAAPRRALRARRGAATRRGGARQQLFARTFRDRASPAYYPHRMAPALSRGAPSAGSLRSLGALLRGEGDGEDDGGDCFGLSPTRDPDATLLGVAEVPLGAVAAAGGDDGLRDSSSPAAGFRCARARAAAGRRGRRARRARRRADDDGGYASADGDDAPAAPPRAQLRCRLELLGARRGAFDLGEAELEVACDEAPPGDDADAPGDGDAGAVAGTGLLSRFRRARHGAVEIQNSLKDAVRLGEQVRGLLEWSQPAFTLLVFGALVLALAVAASRRAHRVAGDGRAPRRGALRRRRGRARRRGGARRRRRRRRRRRLRPTPPTPRMAKATAPRRPRPATGPRGGPAPRGVLRARGRPRRAPRDATRGAASARRRGGRRRRAAPSQPATVWQRLLALLEALPCEPELEQLFSQRRKARDWRRDRRSAARRLGAAWAGPLWRRSTAWRRHFAAVRGPELQFWYSAQHALSGVTPVLVVSLGDARLVDDALASDNLPVLTLHAPLKSKPDVHREWRLAAAHHRDARALQRCICDRADDSRAAAAADAPATPPPEVKKGP